MMLSLLLLGLVAASQLSSTQANTCGRIVCYFTMWSQYRTDKGRFVADDIDLSLCTHLIYTYATFPGNHTDGFEWSIEQTFGMYVKIMHMKARNPSLKILVGIGGWHFGSAIFSPIMQTSDSRQKFINENIQILRAKGFDGFDMDWYYPANQRIQPEDKKRFLYLVQEMKQAFVKEAAETGQNRLLLTAVVSPLKNIIDTAYDIKPLSKVLDFISIRTYDLHGDWDKVTGHHSPLYFRRGEKGDQRNLNIDWAAKYWVKKGAKKEIFNIGLALYGRSFTLDNPTKCQLGAPASKPGKAGQYTNVPGVLAYYEVCDMIKEGGTVTFDKEQGVPFACLGNQWVGYDNSDSLLPKVRYAKKNKFGGVMIWALDLDDFDGSHCSQGTFSLTKVIAKECDHTVKLLPAPILQIPTSPEEAPDDTFCLQLEDGMYADPSNCTKFITCFNGHSHTMQCAFGTAWSENYKACDHIAHTSCRPKNMKAGRK